MFGDLVFKDILHLMGSWCGLWVNCQNKNVKIHLIMKKCLTVFLFPGKAEIPTFHLTAAMGRFVILSTYLALSCLQEINEAVL